ncbi:Uncharacterised protein [Acetobacterium wieringae]|uniref:leucine-rich repeat protein n=1 Tax=Acetobacterium wieringae TaxID=52694 RepID=UPI001DB9007E|nr:leucine-rich repeat protein [Acetobacterium wieringae]VUZ25682.1 Uncharacterised protein [Acetobacterium wieringae]
MKKKLKQIVCLLVSVMLITGSLPIGVLAEELPQPTPTTTENAVNLIEDGFAPAAATVPVTPEQSVPETDPVVTHDEPVLVTPEVNQSMSTAETVTASETITATAIVTDGDYEYDDSVAGVATITKYIGTATTVTIPTTLGGRKVVAIGAGAFNGNTTVQKIIIPLTVTTIASGDATATYTFGGCSSLTEVLIPTSVKTIATYAFSNTNGVKISGYKGSQAEKYASEHGLTFNTLNFSVALTPSLPSGQNIGTSLTLVAAATGGTGTLNYEFYYELEKLDGTNITATIQGSSPASSAEFPLTVAGTYTFYVDVKDDAGYTCTNIIDNYKVIDQPIVNFVSSVSSPQYKDAPIEFTATVSGGTAPYSYEFYHTFGIQTVVDKPKTTTTDTSMSWTSAGFTTVGTYAFYVKVTDKYGTETIKTISDYKIYDYLKVEGFTIDKASPQELGTELKLTATASGGKTDCEYKFSYILAGKTEVIQDYSEQSSTTFTPPKTGTYTFRVEVTNGYGVVEPKEVTGYEIRDTPVIGNFTAAKADGTPFYVGDTAGIVLKAEGVAEGKTPYSYKYFYQNGTGAKTEMTAVDSTNFKPSDAGTYTFFVEVTDASGLKTERQVSNYVVYPKLEGTLVFPASQNRETTVKFAATATGGKSTYKYQFFYKLASEGDDQYLPINQEPSSTKTSSKYFSDPGNYDIKLEITDANGILLTLEELLVINNNPLIDEFNLTGDAFYADQEMQLTAKVDPVVNGSTLVLTAKMGTKSVTIPNSTITTVAATNTFKFTPNAAGTYTFTVTLKNADGTIADTKTMSSIKVLAAPSAKAVKVSKTSGVLLGDTVKLTAGATGGKTAYQYKFYVKKPGETSSEPVNMSFSTANTMNYTVTEVGEYIFYVEILDANGKPSVNKTESASVPIKVTNPAVITDFAATKVTTGTETAVVYEKNAVKLTAKLEDYKGDGELTCEFFYKQGSTEVQIGSPVKVEETSATVKNRMVEATTNFIPPAAGSYTLIVKVTDEQGTRVTKTISNYKVLPLGTTKAIKLSKVSGLLQGETIKLTATASGGKTPYTYAFYVTGPDGVEKLIVTTDNKLTYTNYKLEAVGDYKFSVVITDANGVILATKTQTTSQTIAVTNPPDLKPLTVVKDQTVGTHKVTPVAYENDTLTITAVPNGTTGVAPINYEFQAKLGTTIVDTQNNNTGQFTFTKTKAGSYTFTVTATDKLSSKDVVKQSSYKVLPEVTTKSIKASKTTGLIVGETIKLTAAGSGGKTPYSYSFYYYRDDNKTDKNNITSDPKSKTVTFALPGKGNYEFHVIVTDANGVVSTNSDNLDVSTTATVGNPPVIESLVADKVNGSPVYPGDAVKLTAKVKSGTGLQAPDFQFYYTLGTSRIDIPITTPPTLADPYTAAGTFTPTQAGTYNLCVDVFDGTNTVTQKISSYKVLSDVAVKTFKADKASGVNINTTVKLNAVGTGGKAPYMYEFSYYGQGDVIGTTPPKIIKAYSTDATANFIPTKSGFYTLQVNVKDATGKVCSTSGIIQDFEVVDYPVVKTFTASLPAGQYVGTSIDLTATVDGGTGPYTYTFAYQVNGGTSVPIPASTVAATELKTNTATQKLETAGTYTFTVSVTDSNGSPVASNKIEKYIVYAEPVAKSLTVSKAEIIVGASVTVKAIAEGGKGPLKYKFIFTKTDGAEVVRDYSTTSSYYFKPTAEGTYTVKVLVQDANGHISTELAGDKTIIVKPKPTT